MYDIVVEGGSTNEDCYRKTCAELSGSVLHGLNATVFAYGATGSGKVRLLFCVLVVLFQRIGLKVSLKWSCLILDVTAFLAVSHHRLSPALSKSCVMIAATTSGSA